MDDSKADKYLPGLILTDLEPNQTHKNKKNNNNNNLESKHPVMNNEIVNIVDETDYGNSDTTKRDTTTSPSPLLRNNNCDPSDESSSALNPLQTAEVIRDLREQIVS